MNRSRIIACISMFISLLIWPLIAQAECNPAAILRDNVTNYQNSILTWLSYIDSLSTEGNASNDLGLKIGFAGFHLSLADAQAASNYYQTSTNYQLAESDRISVITTKLSPDSVAAYIACLSHETSNMTLSAPDGAALQQGFIITVAWHPTYTVPVVQGTTSRPVHIDVTNGKPISKNDVIVADKGQVTFRILREKLDEPITIVASIDDKVSDFFTFPARPKYTLDIVQRQNIIEIERSGHYGNSPVSLPVCVDAEDGAKLLVDSAVTLLGGLGLAWKERSAIAMDNGANPLQICATVSTSDEGCTNEACYHKTIGTLRVLEMKLKKLEY